MTKEQRRAVQFKIYDEGLDYCFLYYSDWSQIKDKKFHSLREAYIKAAGNLQKYVGEYSEESGEGEDAVES